MKTPPRIAISLGASFLGYATHAGFLNRLHELGVRPTQVAGASAGAIAAGLFAAGLPRETIRQAIFDSGFLNSFVNKTKWGLHHLRSLCMTRVPSLFDAGGAVDYLESILPGRLIESLDAPKLTIALTASESMRPRLVRSGPLARAMVASCCMPLLFSPLEFEGVPYFDGGIVHETPLDPWLNDEFVDIIILHRVIHTAKKGSPRFPGNIIGLIAATHECASHQLLECRQTLAHSLQKKMIVVETMHQRPLPFSSRRMPEFYEAGERRAQIFFDSILHPLLDETRPQLIIDGSVS